MTSLIPIQFAGRGRLSLAVRSAAGPRCPRRVFSGVRELTRSQFSRGQPIGIRRYVREVIEPLTCKFPTGDGEKGFMHGRLQGFHDFLGGVRGRSASKSERTLEKKDVEPPTLEPSDDDEDRD